MCVTNTTLRRTAQPISFRLMEVSNAKRPFEFYPVEPQQCNNSIAALVPVEKPRTKRRRKPQKPGLTAKNQERHFVVHNYHDHSKDSPQDVLSDSCSLDDHHHRRRGGVAVNFPLKLHEVLDQVVRDGYDHIISWQPHGRAFAIHQPKVFTEHVMPKYFRQSKLTSFQRQLNLYGFQRLTRGADAGAYYCELFLRGMPFLCKKMIRTKVKGTRYKAASSPEQEPDFYSMPPVSPDYKVQRRGEVTPTPSSPVFSSSADSSYNIMALERMVSADVPSLERSDTFDLSVLPPDSFEPLPLERADQANITPDCADIKAIFDEPMEELSEVADFCSTWDPSVDEEIQAALESDEKLEQMIQQLLEG